MKANVALPSIGQVFDASQVSVDRIAVGYWLGLADSVLGLEALGDRYGRTLRLVLGTALPNRLQYPEAGAGMSPVGTDTYKEAVP